MFFSIFLPNFAQFLYIVPLYTFYQYQTSLIGFTEKRLSKICSVNYHSRCVRSETCVLAFPLKLSFTVSEKEYWK